MQRKKLVFHVSNIINGEVTTSHAARMTFYTDSWVGITADIKETVQYSLNQALFQIESILDARWTAIGIYEALVHWK